MSKKNTQCAVSIQYLGKKLPPNCVLWEPQVGSLINRQGLLYRKSILQLLLHTVWSTSLKALGLGEKCESCN